MHCWRGFLITETECDRLDAFRAPLFDVSVWESSGEKQLIWTVCVKSDVRVAKDYTK